MANLFKNPLVLAETVVGSLIDTRAVILYKQPDGDLDQILSANNLQTSETLSETVRSTIMQLVRGTSLEELFTGIEVAYLSQINGYNAYGVSYMSADVNISSDLCQHPLETGEIITDNAIINPVKATVRISMPTAFYTHIYEQIERYFYEKTKIMLQTKFKMYRNMVITALPYKLDNASVDRPQVELELEQVLEAETEYVELKIDSSACLDASDGDTVNYGRQYAQTAADVVLGG